MYDDLKYLLFIRLQPLLIASDDNTGHGAKIQPEDIPIFVPQPKQCSYGIIPKQICMANERQGLYSLWSGEMIPALEIPMPSPKQEEAVTQQQEKEFDEHGINSALRDSLN